MQWTVRMAALHSALWGFDRWYRVSWYVWPAALAFLISGWICIDKPVVVPSAAVRLVKPVAVPVPLAKPMGVLSSAAPLTKQAPLPLTSSNPTSNSSPQSSVQQQLTRCLSIREPNQAYLCTDLINTGQLRGQQLVEAYVQSGFVQREKDPGRAMVQYDLALKVQPNSADALAGRAWINMNRGQYEAALPDLNRAIDMSPPASAAATRYYRGYALLRLKNYPQALTDLNEAIRLQPDNADYYLARGEVQQALERYDAALADFDEFNRRAPNDARGLIWRGEVLDAMGKPQEALAALERAVSLSPGNDFAVSERDRLRAQQNTADQQGSRDNAPK
jgi:tetratricopeptide (TPR) repeat protein